MTDDTKPHFHARETFGGVDLSLSCEDRNLSIVKLEDDDLEQIVQCALERLSGQGKVSEKMKQTCRMVSDL